MGVIRMTRSVKRILSEFESRKDALSGVELIERLNAEMNKTTVYRILDRLEEDGKVHSFIDKDGLRWYAKCASCSSDKHTDFHPHFQCKDCGKVECLTLEFDIPYTSKYKVDNASILLVGRCDSCV